MEGSSIINGFMVNGFESMNLGIKRSWNRKCSAVMDSWLRVASFPYSHGMAKPIRRAEVSSNPSFAWASSQEQGTPTCLLESIPNSNHISATWYSRHICQVTLVPSAAVAGGYPDLLTFLMAKKLREEHGEELRRASWPDLAHEAWGCCFATTMTLSLLHGAPEAQTKTFWDDTWHWNI